MSPQEERDERHEPLMLSGGGIRWVECSCDWTSVAFPTAFEATAAWAEHVRDSKQEAS